MWHRLIPDRTVKIFILSTALFAVSCVPCGEEVSENTVRFTFLHMNDVYEMTPQGGFGGLARLATLEKELNAEHPTYSLLAGDLVSPSAIGTAVVDGKKLSGKQMIAVFNHFLDFMAIGNHEFDIKEEEFMSRLSESQFQWISSNVSTASGQPFPGVKRDFLLEIGNGNQKVKVGLFSLTLDSNKRDWVSYNTDHIAVAKKHINALKNQGADVIVAFTHLALSEDLALAEAVPGIDIVLGGHEHQNIHVYRGDGFTPVAKADANARTVYIHHFAFDLDSKKLDIRSHLRLVDDTIEDDHATKAEVDKWEKLAFDSFREQGIDPDKKVTIPDVPLDGLEGSIRNRSTDLTSVLADGMVAQAKAQASVYNSGSIRIDDVIHAGQTMTEYDLLRVLPFGGTVALYNIRGDLLKQLLGDGMASAGSGGFLQKGNIVLEGDVWHLGGQPIADNQFYQVAVSDYLAGGNESGMEYFSTADERMTLIRETGEFRAALEKGLVDRFGPAPVD